MYGLSPRPMLDHQIHDAGRAGQCVARTNRSLVLRHRPRVDLLPQSTLRRRAPEPPLVRVRRGDPGSFFGEYVIDMPAQLIQMPVRSATRS
jgi:hypothetical protein